MFNKGIPRPDLAGILSRPATYGFSALFDLSNYRKPLLVATFFKTGVYEGALLRNSRLMRDARFPH